MNTRVLLKFFSLVYLDTSAVNFMLFRLQHVIVALPNCRTFSIDVCTVNTSTIFSGRSLCQKRLYARKCYRSPATHIAVITNVAQAYQTSPRGAFPFGYRRGHIQTSTSNAFLPLLVNQLRSLRLSSTKTILNDELSLSKLYDELKALSSEIRYHDDLYYNKDQPIIADEEYDALASREEDICKMYPELLKRLENESEYGSSATRYGGRVGYPVQSNKIRAIESDAKDDSFVVAPSIKRKHIYPMLSLDNVQSNDQLKYWLQRVAKKLISSNESTLTILTEPKLDGVSLTIRYKKTEGLMATKYDLQWACTRGDGQHGTDVTEAVIQSNLAPFCFTVCPTFSLSDEFEIRGEVVLPLSEFRRIKLDQEKLKSDALSYKSATNMTYETTENVKRISLFSNARNAASGILLRKQVKKEEDFDAAKSEKNMETRDIGSLPRKLRFYAYDLVAADPLPFVEDSPTSISYLDIRELLMQLKFTLPYPSVITTLDLSVNKSGVLWQDSDIATMLDFHEALNQHRISQASLSEIEANQKSNKHKGFARSLPGATHGYKRMKWGDYEMDGCVHKICELNFRHILGTSNRAPRWAVAHKFPALSAVTRLQGVEVQVGRTGLLTPVAVLDPVDINGVVVQRATLHNFVQMRQILSRTNKRGDILENGGEILENLTPCRVPVGTPVIVRRAGDVIPQVVSTAVTSLESSRKEENSTEDWISLRAPSHCPACGSPVMWDGPVKPQRTRKSGKKKINDQDEEFYSNEAENLCRTVRCSAPPLLCSPQAIGALQHAFSRDALNIVGLSEARIIQLVDAKILRFPSDLFDLFNGSNTEKIQNLTSLDGWGTKSVKNLETVVRRVASEGISLGRFIYALGIRHVGIHSSTLIATAYHSVDDFIHDLEKVADNDAKVGSLGNPIVLNQEVVEDTSFMRLREQTDSTKGIGPALLSSLTEFASQEQLVNAARNLARRVNVLSNHETFGVLNSTSSAEDSLTSDVMMPLKGQSVVFTGSLPKSISRKQAQAYAISLGAASTPNSISKSTGLLVAAYPATSDVANSKKREQAEKLGIKIIDGETFLAMYESTVSLKQS